MTVKLKHKENKYIKKFLRRYGIGSKNDKDIALGYNYRITTFLILKLTFSFSNFSGKTPLTCSYNLVQFLKFKISTSINRSIF